MVPAAVLILVVVAFRVILGIAGSADMHWMHNFSPLAAVALCGAIYFPRRVAIAFPLGALLLSDLLLNLHYGVGLLNAAMVPQYLALGLICGLGWMLRGRAKTGRVLLASVAGSILFYVLTNTGAWLAEPAYAKSAAGWLQALTTGLPGYPPTLLFFARTLGSDLAFTMLFLACLSFGRGRREAEAGTAPVAG